MLLHLVLIQVGSGHSGASSLASMRSVANLIQLRITLSLCEQVDFDGLSLMLALRLLLYFEKIFSHHTFLDLSGSGRILNTKAALISCSHLRLKIKSGLAIAVA